MGFVRFVRQSEADPEKLRGRLVSPAGILRVPNGNPRRSAGNPVAIAGWLAGQLAGWGGMIVFLFIFYIFK